MFLKGKIPFVRFLIPLITGILIGCFWPAKFILETLPVLFLTILILFGAILVFYKSHNLYKWKWVIGVLIHCFIVLIGYYVTVNTSERFNESHFSKHNGDGLIAAITSEPKLSNGILRFEVNALQVVKKNAADRAVTGKLMIALKIDSVNPIQLNYGQILILPFRFTEVEPPYNPGEFNYKAYLANHQIYYQTFITQSQIVILPKPVKNLIAFAIHLRQKLVLKFQKYLHDPQSASLASTLILGYRADLSQEIINAYSKTGTMHVLSVSGMHVGIVFFVLAFILKPLNRTKYLRFVKACTIILLIWFYALITGFSPSVCRAAVMLSFVVFGKAINRNQNTYNLIAISAFILLIYNPWYLVDVGFQLSYLAVIGLVFLHPKIYHSVYNKYWLADQIWSYCALSLAAQLATFPISLYYFHQFPVYFLASNLFIVLPVIVMMYGGILFLVIPWDFILQPLGAFLNSTIRLTNASLFYIENLPFSTINGIWINSYQYLVIYFIIGCILWTVLLKSRKGFVLSLVFILVLCCSISYKSLQNYNNNQIIFYSLRKNAAIAYLRARQAIVLSDFSAAEKTFSFSIDPYLAATGINKKIYTHINSDMINISRSNFIKLGRYRILRWDKKFNKKLFSYPLIVDALVINGNPNLKIKDVNKYLKYSILLIDGTNNDFKINKWKLEAEELRIKYYILKKNPAYIVKLSTEQ